MQSLRIKNAVDNINFDISTTTDGEPLLTIITTSLAGTEYEKYTVAQVAGEDFDKLREFLEGVK